MDSIITMQNTKMYFGKKHALEDVNINVSKGEIFGLLGPSGAGKTTIINILTGQLIATGGRASLFGEDVASLDDAIYSKIGMVLDTSGLYDRLSCYDNLKVFSDIYGIEKSQILDALESVHLSDAVKLPVSKLSKGMTQRLVFARAILNKPELLFLDEPTSGLDPISAQELHQIILSLREQGTTVFLTTHNMTEATQLCDHVVLLNEGRVVEYGAPDVLCRKYNTDQQIHILLKDGRSEALPNTADSAEAICGYFKNELIESIHSSEPNLEAVFIALTGRKLV